MSYVETNVTEDFGVAKDNKNQEREGNGSRISAVEGRGISHGGRGQGSGQGRIRGRGRSNRIFFNGVNFQDFKQRFHPSEMQHIGSEGNSEITQNFAEANKKRYGDKYRSRRDVKETATCQCGNGG